MLLPLRPVARIAVTCMLAVFAGACLQVDQTLPLSLGDGQVASRTIGPEGGIISVPPDFSMDVPPGAVGSATITVQPRITAPFPSDAGEVLPGTAYDLTPAGLVLAAPATVELRVASSLFAAGDEVKLAVAVLQQDGSLVTVPASYDATSGFLSGDIDVLGPVAAVLESRRDRHRHGNASHAGWWHLRRRANREHILLRVLAARRRLPEAV